MSLTRILPRTACRINSLALVSRRIGCAHISRQRWASSASSAAVQDPVDPPEPFLPLGSQKTRRTEGRRTHPQATVHDLSVNETPSASSPDCVSRLAEPHCAPFQFVQLRPSHLSNVPGEERLRGDSLQFGIDGPEGTRLFALPTSYLRDMCSCAVCRDAHSRQKNTNTTDITSELDPLLCQGISVEGCQPGTFDIIWSSDPATRDQSIQNGLSSHRTRLSFEAISKTLGLRKPEKSLSSNFSKNWDVSHYQKVTLDFDDIVNKTGQAYWNMLDNLQNYGLFFVKGMPDSELAVEQLAETIGPIRNTFYGRTWDVKDKPNAENVAYTSGYLDLHADLLYMKQPPGFQLLHCLRESAEGGESIFADTYFAAEILYEHARDFFDILCDYPVTYAYNHPDKNNFYTDSKPVFEIDHSQLRNSRDTIYNYNQSLNMPPIANVNWSPMFQATSAFSNEGAWRDSGRRFELWLKAARAFHAILTSKENMFRYKLKPGECVIFNNRRVLHGRERFISLPGSGERWLKGTYLDSDDFLSKWRSHRWQNRESMSEVGEALDLF